MGRGITIGLPTIVAALTPAVVASAYFALFGGFSGEMLVIALWALAVAMAHVLELGLPAFLLLHKLDFIRWWSVTALGFLAGGIPFGIFAWPLRYATAGSSSQEN